MKTLIEFTEYYNPDTFEIYETINKMSWPGVFKYTCLSLNHDNTKTRFYIRRPHRLLLCNKCLKEEYKKYIDNIQK